MMHPIPLLVIGITVTIIALVGDFVSATNYQFVFATIIVCNLIAFVCFGYVTRLAKQWIAVALLFSIVNLYTISDVLLRISFGMRVLDFLY